MFSRFMLCIHRWRQVLLPSTLRVWLLPGYKLWSARSGYHIHQSPCELVMARFDIRQYPLMLKQFKTISQIGIVTEYLTEFKKAAHKLLLYIPTIMRPILSPSSLLDWRKIFEQIVLHRPPDVDSALALIQEAGCKKARATSLSKRIVRIHSSLLRSSDI